MNELQELLTRGVANIIPNREALEKKLESGEKIRLYQGFDPTGTQLHIGHLIGLKKLAQFQKQGHEVIFLVGDGTGQAGDPSGKLSTREKFFNVEELRENAKDYVMQAKKIIDFDAPNVKILYNSDWLNKLSLVEILDLLGHFSYQQLIERDMYQERIKNGQDINMREFLYPILQGYDSVAMDVDLEIGGTDQLFNMLCGRKLQRAVNSKEKFVLTTPLLEDSNGVKIGKSEGNVIALNDSPENLYGKIMSLPDDVIVKGLEYLTDVPMEEIKHFESEMSPMDLKKKLAFEIVKELNTEEDAKNAQEYFENTVQNKMVPEDIEEIEVKMNTQILDFLLENNFSLSKSEAKRLIDQDGVVFNDKKIDVFTNFTENGILKIGKRKFVKITIQ